jgi:CO/xanthine dehydrogenase FAD-binding subunit
LKDFVYHKADNLPEAVALNAAYPDYPPLAGGTDLIVQWRSGIRKLDGVVDISCVDELKRIYDEKKEIEIGACATHSDIIGNAAVKKHLPLLVQACMSIGATQIQNRGTIGGNIMNASPAGDALPVLLIYDAEMLLQNVKGERWVPVRDFFKSYRETALESGELLAKIRFPKRDFFDYRGAYYKIGTRRAQAISKVSMCVMASVSHGAIKDIMISLGSMAPVPVRARGTEALLKGKVIDDNLIHTAERSLADEFNPIDDVRSTAQYRSYVCGALIVKFLRESRIKK